MQRYGFHSNTPLGKFRYFPFLGGGGRILLCRPGRTPAPLPPHLAWYLFSMICVPLSHSHLWLLVMEPRALYLIAKCCATEVYPDLAFCIDSSQLFVSCSLCFWFLRQILLYSPDWPQTHSPPASASPGLGSQCVSPHLAYRGPLVLSWLTSLLCLLFFSFPIHYIKITHSRLWIFLLLMNDWTQNLINNEMIKVISLSLKSFSQLFNQ